MRIGANCIDREQEWDDDSQEWKPFMHQPNRMDKYIVEIDGKTFVQSPAKDEGKINEP